MHAEIYLSTSLLEENKLKVFQPIILNEKFIATIGINKNSNNALNVYGLHRFMMNTLDDLNLYEIKRVLPATHVQIVTNLNNFQCSELLTQSLALRLQFEYIVPGSTECFKLLGTDTLIHYVSIKSSSGIDCDNTFSYPIWCSENAVSPAKDSKNASELIDLRKVLFSGTSKINTIYKVSSSTTFEILFAINSSSKTVSMEPLHSYKNPTVKTNPIGLEVTCSAVVDFLRQFSLSASVVQRVGRVEPTGLLLYGLQGCGKKQCLMSIAEPTCVCQFTDRQPLGSFDWYKQLNFIQLSSSEIISSQKVGKQSKQQRTAIEYVLRTKLSSTKNTQPNGYVILLPDLDKWSNANMVNGEHEEEGERIGSNSLIISDLCMIIREISQRIAPVCVLATSSSGGTSLLKQHQDLRNLFYRQLLVSLPNGEQRSRVLAGEISRYLLPISEIDIKDETRSHHLPSSVADEKECERLLDIAANLHGYTTHDLHRLLRASYSAAVSNVCFSKPLKSEEEGMPVNLSTTIQNPPSVGEILDWLEKETLHYRPANLCAEISLFTPMHWVDIGGYDEIKHIFKTTIQQRLIDAANPSGASAQANKCLGLNIPRGVLLHGPPGCSKTLFVRALATECNLPLVAVQASRIFGRYVGDSERNMQRILVHARACAPAILFIDEIDLLLPSRSSSESGVSEHVLGEVLTVMDGVEGQCGQLMLIAATNRLEKLDPALRRAGRFDLTIKVPPPDAVAREAIARIELTKRATCPRALDTNWLADFAKHQLTGYTGAEVVSIVHSAAELAREDGKAGSLRIDRNHLTSASARQPPSTLDAYKKNLSPPTDIENNYDDEEDSADSPPDHFSWKSQLNFTILIAAVLSTLIGAYIASQQQ